MAMSSGGGGEGAPMMDINTTPLIDVMLVLLIMFIITIPIQTHAVKLDLPPPNPLPQTVDPVFNQIDIDFLGNIYWNKTEVTLPTLNGYLKQAVALPTEPELRLHPEGLARYEVVDKVMATAQQAGVTKMGFVGNEAYAS
ncbi:ExbD/TolR family protein [Glacieibacterium sp.]|uniref:ExbD/TolR family protein n=1 Tax=Glacieibacterium sp. TaxID=2860237 RepID=UPI003B000175